MNGTPIGQEPGEVRVLRLFSRLNVGGPSIHVLLLASGLEERGYATLLLVGKESEHEGNLLDLARDRGVRCVQLETLGREIEPLEDLRSLRAVYRQIREFRPLIVHTHTAKAGVVGRLAARFAGVPIVVHTYHGHVLRGYFGPVREAVFRWAERLLGLTSDALIAVSESVREDLVRLGVARASKIRVVPLGLDLRPLTEPLPRGHLRKEARIDLGSPLIGIVGRLVRIKDIPAFLDTAAIVHKSLPDAHFAVVGDGEERTLLQDRATELGLGAVVHFHGWQRDMRLVYGDLDVVVNTSQNEGTPVALIEAMAAGRPVVATRVGGTPDLLGGGLRGILVPPSSPDETAQAILQTLGQAEATATRVRSAREYVLSFHSAERLLNDMDTLYRELLGTRAAGS